MKDEIVVSAKMYSSFNTGNKVLVRLSRPLRFRLKLALWIMQIAAWLAYAEYAEDGEWKSGDMEEKPHIGTIAQIDFSRGIAIDTQGNTFKLKLMDSVEWTSPAGERHPL